MSNIEGMDRTRLDFFDEPRFQAALSHMDGWGYVELGTGHKLVQTYAPLHAPPGNKTWPQHAVFLHAAVDGCLAGVGYPRLLVAFLRHRYPRCVDPVWQGDKQLGVHHRNSVSSFVRHAIRLEAARTWAAQPWEIVSFLERREREFIRTLRQWLRGDFQKSGAPP